MSALSHFQTLPEFIVEDILGYLLQKQHKDNDPNILGLSLLHSCSLWRTLFIKEAQSNLEIELSSDLHTKFTYLKWPWLSDFPSILNNRFVKDLCVSFSARSWRIKKTFFNLFKSHLSEDTTFDSVRHLELKAMLSELNGSLANTFIWKQILCRLGKIIPNIKSICFDCYQIGIGPKHLMNETFIEFALGLSIHISDLEFRCFDRDVDDVPQNIAHIGDLTNLYYTCWINPDSYNQVVRRNAGTLKVLNARYKYWGHVDSLLFDGNQPVFYPQLTSLDIIFIDNDTKTNVSSQSNHFPVLKRLALGTSNLNLLQVFFDNRGATYDFLEYLELHDRLEHVADFYAFTSGCLKCLKGVSFRVYGENIGNFAIDNIQADKSIEFFSLIMDAAGELRQLSICGTLYWSYIKRLLLIPDGFARMHKIRLPDTKMGLSDILRLLDAAPFLQLLEISIAEDYPPIPNAGSEDLFEHTETKYTDLGKHFRRMYLTSDLQITTFHNVCITIAILVTAFPNLYIGFTGKLDIDMLRQEIELISRTYGLSKHSHRLNAVLKNVAVQNECVR